MNRETIKNIDITPDKSLMPKMAKSGYTITEAISELIDNSIDAQIANKKLTIIVNVKENKIEKEWREFPLLDPQRSPK